MLTRDMRRLLAERIFSTAAAANWAVGLMLNVAPSALNDEATIDDIEEMSGPLAVGYVRQSPIWSTWWEPRSTVAMAYGLDAVPWQNETSEDPPKAWPAATGWFLVADVQFVGEASATERLLAFGEFDTPIALAQGETLSINPYTLAVELRPEKGYL